MSCTQPAGRPAAASAGATANELTDVFVVTSLLGLQTCDVSFPIIAGLQAGHLSHHHRQQRIGGDVERHAEEDVGGPLIEVTGKPPLRDVELKQHMTGR